MRYVRIHDSCFPQDQNKLRRISLLVFRRNASAAITNGADIASVSEVLGHADKATTLRMYTHADEESKRRAADLVFKAIGQE